MKYRWLKNWGSNEKVLGTIVQNLRIPRALAQVLVSRGMTSLDKVLAFFYPEVGQLYSAFLMPDMEKAIDRLHSAITSGEKILIYGDYDVDGVVSTAILVDFIRQEGGVVEYRLSERQDEVYGLSEAVIDDALAAGVTLLITVDIGTTSVEAVAYAAKRGLDVIICDHHELGRAVPEAYAFLNPFAPHSRYPWKFLAAAGVTFKFIQAYVEKYKRVAEIAFQYLDLVAVATASDMVPLVDENRIFVHHGLKQLNISPRVGIAALLHCISAELPVTTATISYLIAPLINAAGRLGDASIAVELLLCQDELTAFRYAQELQSKNHQRRVIDDQVFSEALLLAEEYMQQGYHSLVLYNPDWHAGVINIIASRLAERYHVPVVVLTDIENQVRGSARSIPALDLLRTMQRLHRYLVQYGGHRYAVGLSMKKEYIDEFRERFERLVQQSLSEEQFIPELYIDAELSFTELSPQFLDILQRFAPFGYQNPNPLFVAHNVRIVKPPVSIGGNTMKFRAKQGNFVIDVIIQNQTEYTPYFKQMQPLSMVFSIEGNGRNQFYLSAKDLKLYTRPGMKNLNIVSKTGS